MRYSEHPHEFYIIDGEGPGAEFIGDLDKWNWRYLFKGLEIDKEYDATLSKLFNESQRELMQMAPLDVIDQMRDHLAIKEGVEERAAEAQTRLFGPRITSVEDNVVVVNFRKLG